MMGRARYSERPLCICSGSTSKRKEATSVGWIME